MMNVILLEDVPDLGVVGDLISVKDGYGRNFLIPQGKATFASRKSVRQLEHQKRLAAHRRELATVDAEKSKTQIEALSICISAKVAPAPVNDEGQEIAEVLPKLFGSVTNRDIAKVVAESGFKVDHRRVVLADSVRTVGKFVAKIRLDGGIHANVDFWVIAEGATDIETEKRKVEEAQAAQMKQTADRAAAEAEALKASEPAPAVEDASSEDASSEDASSEA